jgi:hypothetical protein
LGKESKKDFRVKVALTWKFNKRSRVKAPESVLTSENGDKDINLAATILDLGLPTSLSRNKNWSNLKYPAYFSFWIELTFVERSSSRTRSSSSKVTLLAPAKLKHLATKDTLNEKAKNVVIRLI